MHSDITKPRSLFGKRGALNIYIENSKKATAKTESHVREHNNELSRNQSSVIIENGCSYVSYVQPTHT